MVCISHKKVYSVQSHCYTVFLKSVYDPGSAIIKGRSLEDAINIIIFSNGSIPKDGDCLTQNI